MRKLLWVGDAVVASGFARCTHEVLDVLRKTWDVHVLGINYLGDPHPFPYSIYPCWPGKDGFGVGRVGKLVEALQPEVVVLQNDPWNVPEYLDRIPKDTPVVASMPVDGRNCRGEKLNGLAHAIFWTNFGLREARLGGYDGPASVIPLGVDIEVFTPGARLAARQKLELPESMWDGFIVGNVNRNQPRKRLDLTIRYFCEWVSNHHVDDAYLFLHVAPTGDSGYDLAQLFRYYGVKNRLLLMQPRIGPGAPEDLVLATYRSFDVQVTTTQGEGWGLTTMEGMACGIPQIVPEWAALGEWAQGAVVEVPCHETCVTPNFINAIGGVPDRETFIGALATLHANAELRKHYAQAGLTKVREPEYRWSVIGQRFVETLDSLTEQRISA